MLVECKNCKQYTGDAQMAMGILTIMPAAIITMILSWLVDDWLGPLWTLACFFPAWFGIAWVLWELPRWRTYLRYCTRPCPHCGVKSWGRPDYSGFGF